MKSKHIFATLVLLCAAQALGRLPTRPAGPIGETAGKTVGATVAETAGTPADTLHLYLIGDSTCATKKLDKENPERGWGHMLQPLFDEAVVVGNHATNGRSTKSFRDEGRWARVERQLRPGDYVFIQFGHNARKSRLDPLFDSGAIC